MPDEGLLKNKRKQVVNCVRNTLYWGHGSGVRNDIASASNVFQRGKTYLRFYDRVRGGSERGRGDG